MGEPLEQLLKKILDDQALYSDKEERVKHAVILPILNNLQWDCFNQREVISEFNSGKGRVDYCLHVKNKDAVFIEVKKSTEDLERHEEQLLNYAFQSGIEIAILTNGLVWWLYLPLTNGPWQQRRFFTIDITQQSPEQAAKHFQEFLHKDNIVNGSAIVSAKLTKDNKEKRVVIAKSLPIAWNEIVKENDEHLLDIIANRVENLCGYRPELEDVSRFVDNLIVNKIHETTGVFERNQKKNKTSTNQIIQQNLDEHGEITNLSLKIGEQEIHANAVSDLYEKVIKNLVDNTYLLFRI